MTDRIRVLVIDDNPQDRALVTRAVTRRLAVERFCEVGTERQFSAALSTFVPDVVITDYALQWGTGLEVLEEVSEHFPGCATLMYTGTGNEEVAVQALRRGLDDYIVKSRAGPEKLARSVEWVLRARRQRARVAELEGQLSELLQRLPVGVYRSTPDGRLLWANECFLGIVGFPDLDALRALDAADLYVDPQTRVEWLSGLASREGVAHETILKRRDGREVWVRDRARLVRAPDHEELVVEGIIEDISMQVEAEASVRRHERSLALLQKVTAAANSSTRLAEVLAGVFPDVCREDGWVIGQVLHLRDAGDDGIRLEASDLHFIEDERYHPFLEATVGWVFPPGQGIPGRVLTDRSPLVIPDVSQDAEYQRRDEAARLGLRTALFLPIEVGESVVAVLELYAPEVRDLSDQYVSTMKQLVSQLARVSEREIAETERREAEAHRRTTQKLEAVGRLASGMAHDFNNLMTAISMEAELLLRGDRETEVAEGLRNITSTVGRSRDLTTQLLSFARGRAEGDPEPLDVVEVVRNILRMLERLVGDTIRINVQTRTDTAVVLGLRSHLEQVLVNLVVNARDAMPEGGTIVIETETVDLARGMDSDLVGPHVLVSITDDGEGMSKEVQDRIFEPFFSTKGEAGSGLGLATSYGIVRRMEGRIRAYTEIGMGTTMRVLLPTMEGEAPMKPTVEPPVVGGSETILVVDDDTGVLDAATRALEALGYRVLGSASVDRARAVFQERADAVDLLFTDVALPDGRGPELAAELRVSRPDLPVVLATGYGNLGSLDHQVASHVMRKPYSIPDMARRLREVLDALPSRSCENGGRDDEGESGV